MDYNRNAQEAPIKSKYFKKTRRVIRIGMTGFVIGAFFTASGYVLSTANTHSLNNKDIEYVETCKNIGKYAKSSGYGLMPLSLAFLYFSKKRNNKKCLEELSELDN